MRRLIPEYILDKFANGEFSGEYPAVVLFADISGFSLMTERLMDHGQHGAEILAGLMRRVFDPMIESVFHHHGFIPTLAGDAITAVFPTGKSERQAVRHAFAAAWQMQEAIRKESHYSNDYGEFDITVRIGIALGQIEWGILTSNDNQRAAYYFRGSAIERCAIVDRQAKPGEIVVDDQTAVHLDALAVMSPLDGCFRIDELSGELPKAQTYLPQKTNLEVMTKFFPERLIQQVSDGEFRQVVNLFINLPTIRTRNQLRILMRSMFEIQDKYGGLLNRLDFGDKGAHFLLFWGAPQAYENDIQRALDFVLTLQEETSIPIHAGIAYRISHAGFIGSPLREEYTCYGKGVNLAARLMVFAPRGKIWLDEPIAKRAEKNHLIEYLEEKTFKGFADPQLVFELQERKEKISTIFQGDFVGRQSELRQLSAFLQPLEQGRFCGVLVVEGEAGIGKSRLVHEIHKMDEFSPSAVYWARCQTKQFVRESFNPFRYWLKQYFGVSETQGEARNKRNFNYHLDDLIFAIEDSQLVDELDRTRSFLGALLGLYWSDSLYEETEAQIRYENTLAGLAALLLAEANRQPVILLLEDAHWLDADSQMFISYLVSKLESEGAIPYPIAILATARAYEEENFFSETHPCQKIVLGELGNEQINRLAVQIIGAPATPGLFQLLVDLAAGNPFFIEQLLHFLVEQGSLFESEHGMEVKRVDAAPLPMDVRTLLVARLDQLDRKEKQAVQYASILGREFDFQILARMFHDEASLSETISACEQKAIWTLLGENRYIFNHALMQEAAYKMQTRTQRASLHAEAVSALEHQFSEDLETFFGELAYHSENAGDFSRAFHFYQQAAERAVNNYANQEAIANFNGAINLHEKISPEPKEIADLFSRRGRVLELTGEFDLALADFELSQQIAFAADEPQLAWQSYGDLGRLWASRDYQKTHNYFQQALDFARQTGELIQVGSSLNWMGNWYLNNENPIKASQYHHEALEIFTDANDKRQNANTLDFLGMAYLLSADLKSSGDCYDRAVELYRELNDRPGLITSLMGRGANVTCLYMLTSIPSKQPKDAFQDYEEAIQLARTIGSPLLETGPYWALGLLNIIQGNFREANQVIQRGFQLSEQIRHREWRVSNLYALGIYYSELFAVDQAINLLEEALESAQELQSQVWTHWVSSALGKAYILKNDLSKAKSILEQVAGSDSAMDTLGRRCCWAIQARIALIQGFPRQALQITSELIESAPGMGSGQVITYLWLLKGEALAEMGKEDEALILLEQAEENSRRSGETFLLWRVNFVRAQLFQAMGHRSEAQQELGEGRRLIQKMGMTIDDQDLRSSFFAGAEYIHR